MSEWEDIPTDEPQAQAQAQGWEVTAYEKARSLFSDSPAKKYEENLKSVRSYRDAGREQYPNTTTASQLAGSMVGGAGAYKTLGTYAPKTLFGSTLFGGGEGAINAIGSGDTGDEIIGNLATDIPLGALGGAAGYGISEGIGRIARTRGYIPDGIRNQQAAEIDYKLSPGQLYDDYSLQQIEAAMRSDPGYSKAFQAMDAHNQLTATRIMTKAMGKESDTLLDSDMGAIAKNITNKFKKAGDSGDFIDMDANWLDDLDAIEGAYKKIPGKPDKAMKVITDLRNLADDFYITPKEYQTNYSAMGKELDKAAKAGDGNMVEVYSKIRRALDSVADRSSANTSKDFNEARQLYKAKKIIQKPGVMHESGRVSPLSLANKLRSDTKGYLEGGNQSDLYNLARVARSKSGVVGDSFTATRSMGPVESVTMGPLKESLANLYLSGKLGTSIYGPRVGIGGKVAMPVANAVPGLLDNLRD